MELIGETSLSIAIEKKKGELIKALNKSKKTKREENLAIRREVDQASMGERNHLGGGEKKPRKTGRKCCRSPGAVLNYLTKGTGGKSWRAI